MTLLLDGIWGAKWRLSRMKRHLESQIDEVKIYSYDSSGQTGLEQLGAQLATYIARQEKPVNVVGFSMGGLVIRSAHWIDPNLKIGRAVFLNTPHQGSLLAHLLPLMAVKQMKPGGEFLRQLQSVSWNVPSLVFWCPGDLMVFPGQNAKWLPVGKNCCCYMPLHVWPLISKRIHYEIATFLKTS